jgi:hydrogenase/urease accessory protein HupE
MRHLFRAVIFACCAVWGGPFAWAHDPGLSSANITVFADHIGITTTFASNDARWLIADETTKDTMDPASEAFHTKLAKAAPLLWSLRAGGRELFPSATAVSSAAGNNVVVVQDFPIASPASLEFATSVFGLLPSGHREHATITIGTDHLLVAKLLSSANTRIDAALPAKILAAASPIPSADTVSFTEFLRLGIEHILTGYDHLLFLFAFLITARGFRPILKIITSFTIAHSITLGLSALNIVYVSSRWVEPLIAATIVFVALQNLFKRDRLAERAGLTFAFGLIHGFGFASVLRDMGIASLGTSAWRALAGFNAGVEIGQLAVASVVLPILWYFRSRPSYERSWIPIASALIALAGSYWFIQRVAFA